MAVPMIAQRIFNGETAEQIGITETEYASRKETLDRFLQENTFTVSAYLEWLKNDSFGKRGELTQEQISRGIGDTIAKLTSAVGIKPCGGCKKRQQKLNKLFPYGR